MSSRGALSKYQKLGSLKTEIISSQFWRPKAQHQGINKVGSIWELWGIIWSLPLLYLLEVAGDLWCSLSTSSSHSVFSGCESVSKCPIFYKESAWGPTLFQYDLIWTNYLCNFFFHFQKKVTFGGTVS